MDHKSFDFQLKHRYYNFRVEMRRNQNYVYVQDKAKHTFYLFMAFWCIYFKNSSSKHMAGIDFSVKSGHVDFHTLLGDVDLFMH